MKVIVPILLAFVAIAVMCAHTNLPWSDEAWFASPALNLPRRPRVARAQGEAVGAGVGVALGLRGGMVISWPTWIWS